MKSFKEINLQIRKNLKSFNNYFFIEVDRDKVWDTYLNSFPEEIRNEFNCNSCKSFLRQFSGIVEITKDYDIKTLFDGDFEDPVYNKVFKNLSDYIKSLNIISSFDYGTIEIKGVGTEVHHCLDKITNEPISWYHFYLSKSDFTSLRRREVLFKYQTLTVFDMLSLNSKSVDLIIELIRDNNLYRGDSYLNILLELKKLIVEFNEIKDNKKTNNFIWSKCYYNNNLLSLKNSVIGQLLLNLEESNDLEASVRKYENMVAPQNYKRPKAIVTKAQIERAEKEIKDNGYLDSLYRRFAKDSDLNINNLLFVNNRPNIKSVFDDIKKDIIVDVNKVKSKDITSDEFFKLLSKGAKNIKILTSNDNNSNYVTLLTSLYNDSKNLFKWDNNFSWAYTNGVTDSIKDRVKKQGGETEGELRISLSWHNYDDLDLHVLTNKSKAIYYASKDNKLGKLDVDMNVSAKSRDAVENVIYKRKNKLMNDYYEVIVNNFTPRESEDVGFTVEIENNGKIYKLTSQINPRRDEHFKVCSFSYDVDKGVYNFKTSKNVIEDISISSKWNINSNSWVNVSHIMKSPNYWDDNKVGLEHLIFILDDCNPDENINTFFNEYIKDDIIKHHKRSFELLSSKLKIDPIDKSLSGLGYSKGSNKSIILDIDNNIYNLKF